MFFQCFKLDIFSVSYQQAVVVEHWDFPNTEISSLKMLLWSKNLAEHWDLPNTGIFYSKDIASAFVAISIVVLILTLELRL
jgi:hypothetical protein